MGNFSRDPKTRLIEAVTKHYVGVRLQQGVPILDADWNEMEDLRKYELKSLIRQFIGDGVPTGNDGFSINALAGNGVGTIVLKSAMPGVGYSSLDIDFTNSTGAATLGFLPGRAYSQHPGSSPARLTGNATEPFNLSEGMTITVKANGKEGETITFKGTDFAEISRATAAEVVQVINSNLTRAIAETGSGNDFLISGGDGTSEGAGRILAEGEEVINETDLTYSSQSLYENTALAGQWNVPVIPPLTGPSGSDRQDIVYIDVWEREILAEEDDQIVQPAIGIETAIRLKREWAIRVAPSAADLSGITRIANHRYLILARLNRKVTDGNMITEVSISDMRKRQLKLADAVVSPIFVKGPFGIDKVNPGLFVNMLRSISQVYLSLMESDYFLGDYFNDVTAVESVRLLRAFQDIRNLAESGITDVALQRFDNTAALRFMLRLFQVQRDLVDSMRLLTNGITRRGTRILLDTMETWLEGDGASVPGLRKNVMPGETPDLGNAYDAQIFINNELGRRVGVLPRGLLEIQFVSATSSIINPGASYELIYSIKSILNVDETIELAITDTNKVFNFTFKDLNENPNHPGDLSKSVILLQKDQKQNIAFNLVVPHALPPGTQSRIIFNARSKRNPDGIDFANVEISVMVGSRINIPAAGLQLMLLFPEINLATDVVPVGKASDGNHVIFRLAVSHLVNMAIEEEFVFTVDFIGNSDAFEVLGAATLNPFNLPGAIQGDGSIKPESVIMPVGATNTAVDGQASLMVVRLAKTDITLPQPFYRELHIRIVANII